MLLEGKVAMVTGGSRGIGRADALALAREGADVALTDILLESDTSAADGEKDLTLSRMAKEQGFIYTERTVQEIQAMGRRALGLKLDVTDAAQVASAVDRVTQAWGGIDILINNAAILDHVGTIETQTTEMWERVLKVNLTGAFHCAKAVLPGMKKRAWGRIVNMASVAGTMGGFGQASYSASKAAMIGLTRTLALEGAKHNITCNAIVPGIIMTEAYKAFDPAMVERMVKRVPSRKAGVPEDVAHAIVFLCSEKARYLTGVALPVTGGIELFTF
jgi:3-oxoacyl-[acyl-carrier protein] reductase